MASWEEIFGTVVAVVGAVVVVAGAVLYVVSVCVCVSHISYVVALYCCYYYTIIGCGNEHGETRLTKAIAKPWQTN